MIIQEFSFVEKAEFVLIWAVKGMSHFGHNSNSVVAKIYIQIQRCGHKNTAQNCPCKSMFINSTLAVTNAFAMPKCEVVENTCM